MTFGTDILSAAWYVSTVIDNSHFTFKEFDSPLTMTFGTDKNGSTDWIRFRIFRLDWIEFFFVYQIEIELTQRN